MLLFSLLDCRFVELLHLLPLFFESLGDRRSNLVTHVVKDSLCLLVVISHLVNHGFILVLLVGDLVGPLLLKSHTLVLKLLQILGHVLLIIIASCSVDYVQVLVLGVASAHEGRGLKVAISPLSIHISL